jgi:mannose/fructose/N-acetylgalactosamine-specific phosphotransferase system component IIB
MLKFTLEYEKNEIVVKIEKETGRVKSGTSISFANEEIVELKRLLCKEIELFHNKVKSNP